MAKHPHKLILLNKKTWRCALEGCNFFVHLGLAHVLIGKQGICWNCGEQFMLDPISLKEEMPTCIDCREGNTGPTMVQKESMIELRIFLGKNKKKHLSEFTSREINTFKMMGLIPDNAEEIQSWIDGPKDEVETHEPNE